MADIRSRRVEISFMMRESFSLELVRVLNSFCARVEMLLCTGDKVVQLMMELSKLMVMLSKWSK
jgi:hypothetical protein